MNAALPQLVPAPRPRPVPLGKIDRCWVPLDDPDIARFFGRALFVPHDLRQRLRWTAAGVLGGATRLHRLAGLTAILHAAPAEDGGEPVRVSGGGPPSAIQRLEEEAAVLYALLDELRDALPAGDPPGWLLIEDYGQGERWVCALFAGGDRPRAVLKVRPAADPSPLAWELRTLEQLRKSLPAPLAATLPEPLAWRERGHHQALLLAALPGRSAYVEMQAAWRPRARTGAHFAAAGEWLAGFHGATRAGAASPTPPTLASRLRDVVAGPEDAWLDRLDDLASGVGPPLAAVHGDFWARNLLLPDVTGSLPGVVDWEAASPSGPCTQDLFHFALTYALNAPWSAWRRLPPRQAFRRAFLEDNALSRELVVYFADYCRRLELDRERLGRWFTAFLLERAAAAAERPDVRPAALEPWLGFLEEITWADRSVFSG